jgi:hypothetical protein
MEHIHNLDFKIYDYYSHRILPDNSKVVNVLQIQMKRIILIYQVYFGWEVNDGECYPMLLRLRSTDNMLPVRKASQNLPTTHEDAWKMNERWKLWLLCVQWILKINWAALFCDKKLFVGWNKWAIPTMFNSCVFHYWSTHQTGFKMFILIR